MVVAIALPVTVGPDKKYRFFLLIPFITSKSFREIFSLPSLRVIVYPEASKTPKEMRFVFISGINLTSFKSFVVPSWNLN